MAADNRAPALVILVSAAIGLAAGVGPAAGELPPGATGGTVRVPFDHDAPEAGDFALLYELGAPFDPGKPTVLYCQDGQQFRVREGRVGELQADLFDERVNLVGVPGRIFTPAVAAAVRDPDGGTDWRRAYRFYCSRQWCGDLDAVRRAVLGEAGRMLLYGRSGGALLVQEYLARHGDAVVRAFMQAPPNPRLERELGRPSDPFWAELGDQDPRLQTMLLEALDRLAGLRGDIVVALSRQHFFHKAEDLAAERAAFIGELHAGDLAALERRKEQYQVDAVNRLQASHEGIAVTVRQYELFQPVADRYDRDGPSVAPTPEMQRRLVEPLLALHEAGDLPGWDLDLDALERYEGEVFILAGTRDAAIPVAYQRRLAGLFRRATLLLVRDDHMMKGLQAAGLYRPLHREFLLHGADSPPLADLLAEARARGLAR